MKKKWPAAAVLLLCAVVVLYFAIGSHMKLQESREQGDLLLHAESAFAYNNFSDSLGATCWVFEDEVVYSSGDDILFVSGDGESVPLVSHGVFMRKMPKERAFLRSAFLDKFYFTDSKLYFTYWSSTETALFCYDLISREYQAVCRTPITHELAVIGEHYYYLVESQSFQEEDEAPLIARNIHTGEERQICPRVSALGIVNGKLRYVSLDKEAYQVLEYDEQSGLSSLLGAIPADFGRNCQFSFTPDSVVMGRFGQNIYNFDYKPGYASKIIVYNLSSGEKAEYPLPSEIHHFVACDRFAYAYVYKLRGGGPPEVAGCYRVDLTNGETEKLPHDLNGVVGLWASSDNTVYIQQYHIFREARGALYRIDMASLEETFIAWLQ